MYFNENNSCFVQFYEKNYKAEYTPDKFQFNMNSFDDTFWGNVWHPETVEGKAFDAFRMLFYSGQIEVED